jgi:CRISPR system Cascade subunit CasB
MTQDPARALGPPPDAPDKFEKALMKPIRFRRLIAAGTLEDRLTMLRRAVRLADEKMNLRELARACFDWSEETRRRWIFEYYNAGAAAPDTDDTLAKENVR